MKFCPRKGAYSVHALFELPLAVLVGSFSAFGVILRIRLERLFGMHILVANSDTAKRIVVLKYAPADFLSEGYAIFWGQPPTAEDAKNAAKSTGNNREGAAVRRRYSAYDYKKSPPALKRCFTTRQYGAKLRFPQGSNVRPFAYLSERGRKKLVVCGMFLHFVWRGGEYKPSNAADTDDPNVRRNKNSRLLNGWKKIFG